MQVRYNDAQRRTRIVIERCFGVLKRCFPCLHVGLHTHLGSSLVILGLAIVALRNFAMMQKMDLDDDEADPD